MSESTAGHAEAGGEPASAVALGRTGTLAEPPSAAPTSPPTAEELFRAEGTALVRLARIFTDDRNAAEDLVQEAFIRYHRSRHRIEDSGAAAAYLRSIVCNLARDHNRRGLMSRRHHARRPRDPLPAPLDATVVDRLVSDHEGERVMRALHDLSKRQRDCLVLRFHLELTEREIGETLGISPNTVKTHVRRGLATLQLRLGGRDGN
ncbi:MAG TPA: sigma-70 family RNA polymerase sigma factor [Nitriliruptoraceae bacterium]|nr:sigma-70 family RNA polymerase sigma factor [Nitriliruptoraceae bacterium]